MASHSLVLMETSGHRRTRLPRLALADDKLAGDRSWRREWRRFQPAHPQRQAEKWRFGGWRKTKTGAAIREQIQLLERRPAFRFALRIFSSAHQFANGAGMLPVESVGDSPLKRALSGVFDDHPNPRDRLQQRPMKGHRQRQHRHQQPFGCSHDHDGSERITPQARCQLWAVHSGRCRAHLTFVELSCDRGWHCTESVSRPL